MRINCLLIACSFVLFGSACSENDQKTTPMPDQKNATVSGMIKHHDAPIPGAMVYIKSNTLEFPGVVTTVYSDSTTADSNGLFQLIKLSIGRHYLFSTGFDSGINEIVMGGIPITIKFSGEKKIADIPVTEE